MLVFLGLLVLWANNCQTDHQICSICWKGHFGDEKILQTVSKLTYNVDSISCCNNPTTVTKPFTGKGCQKQSEKHQTLSRHTDVRCSISTKLGTMIEEVAPSLHPWLCGIPSVVYRLGPIENIGENSPLRLIVYSYIALLFVQLKQPNFAEL